jgi:hypothetical protein
MTTTALAARAPTVELGSLSDLTELGQALAASGYFADAREAAQAVTKVLAGRELGFGPIASMTGVYLVKGRVTLSANLMAAAIKRHPKYDYRVKDLTDDQASVAFYEAGQEVGTSDFSMKDARDASLAGGDNWRKYPRNMLFARALSNGAKWFCPDVFAGAPVYTPDELGADVDPETGEIIEASIPTATVVPTPRPSEPAPPLGPSGSAPASAGEQVAGDESAVDVASPAAPPEDPTRQVTADEVTKLSEFLDALNAPESFRTMARMAHGVSDMESLSVGQAREIMEQAKQRADSWKAATT